MKLSFLSVYMNDQPLHYEKLEKAHPMNTLIFIYILLSLLASILIYSACVVAARADRAIRSSKAKPTKAKPKKSLKIDVHQPKR